MDADDLTKTERATLDFLKQGKGGPEPWGIATKGRIVDGIDYSRNSVYNALGRLEAAGHVELIHPSTREYQYVDDPREDQ